jgi:hypothetical protein
MDSPVQPSWADDTTPTRGVSSESRHGELYAASTSVLLQKID